MIIFEEKKYSICLDMIKTMSTYLGTQMINRNHHLTATEYWRSDFFSAFRERYQYRFNWEKQPNFTIN